MTDAEKAAAEAAGLQIKNAAVAAAETKAKEAGAEAGKAAAQELVAVQVKTATDELKTVLVGVEAAQKKHGEDIDKLALDFARNGGSKAGNAPDEDEFLKAYTGVVEKVKSRQRGGSVEFGLSGKAAVTMLTGATLPGRIIPTQTGPLVGRENVFQHVRDLVAPGNITSNTLTYPRAIAQEGGPAITAEGAKKPQMSFTFEEVIAPVKKIPVYFKCSTELLADAPAFVSYMRAQAAEAIKDVEDTELLYGDNSSTHLQGIIPLAAAFDVSGIKVSAPQRIDILRLAVAQVRRAKFRATAIMMNPDDVAALELTKDAEGRYMLPTVLTGILPMMVGRVEIIEVDAMNEGEFLVGAFDRGAQVFEREGLTIRIFDQNEDDAIKNLVTVVLEERLVNAVYRPASFVKGTFSTAIAAAAAVA